MPDTEIRFGAHVPVSVDAKRPQSPMAVFTRGLQLDGTQWKFRFTNGYGASVINDGYGGEEGKYELAVLDSAGHLTYKTPVTEDVLGFLTEDGVTEALDAIAALAPADAEPTLARRIIDLPEAASHAFLGMVAGHFATADTLDRATVARLVDEAIAVSS